MAVRGQRLGNGDQVCDWQVALAGISGDLRSQPDEAVGHEATGDYAPHAMRAAALPMHHGDPFDRMLVAQAQLEGMELVSADEVFRKYKEPVVVWAGK